MENVQQNVSISLLQGMMTEIKELFRETDRKFQATDKKFQATDKKFQATESLLDKQIKERKEDDKRLKEKFDNAGRNR